MTEFKLLKNDYYQLAMCVAYILLNQANDKAGFEGFVRRINPKINPDQDFYYFGGNKEAIELLETVKCELHHHDFLGTFLELIETKLPEDKKNLYMRLIKNNWKYLDKDFHYTVYPENAKLFPYVPAVQYYGPKWIGQLLETPLINCINGKTGFNTLDRLDGFDSEGEKNDLYSLVFEDPNFVSVLYKKGYFDALTDKAIEYRNSTNKVLLEAGYRRACGAEYASTATIKALQYGWDGTSNTSVVFPQPHRLPKVGGTMAHSFIMSQRNELEAYHLWNSIYPNSTILIDTYDTMIGLSELIDYNIKPACVRIDSEPLDILATQARKVLDANGWDDVEIFISGDLTPERLRDFEERGIPFDRCMAGTSYVNVGGTDKVNAEFVYKLVEFEKDGKVYYPEKKAKGKDSRSGLKYVEYDQFRKLLKITTHKIQRKTLRNWYEYLPMDLEQRKAWMGFFGVAENNDIETTLFEPTIEPPIRHFYNCDCTDDGFCICHEGSLK